MNHQKLISELTPEIIDARFNNLDEPPPSFTEIDGELLDRMYNDAGCIQIYGVFVPPLRALTLRQAAMRLYPYCLPEKSVLLGPLIIEHRVVIGGFAWWLKEENQNNS